MYKRQVPFIVLDLVVANILLALGMFMLSPTIISLPFKLLIFIAVDGWALIVQGLVQSYNSVSYTHLDVYKRQAQGGTKPATLETGAVVQVPFFVSNGDVIRVDTRSNEYLDRC